MELIKFLFPFGLAIVAWLVISQFLAGIIAGSDEDHLMNMWMFLFMGPIIIAYLAVSWLQMKYMLYLYANYGWVLPMKEPSDKIADYIP